MVSTDRHVGKTAIEQRSSAPVTDNGNISHFGGS